MKKIAPVLMFLAAAALAAEKLTNEQLAAQFFYDLGPSTIDVSAYPKEQQAGYAVFAKTCSQCHTLARPINAPYVTSIDWQRYVLRMHQRTKVRPGKVISKADSKVIVDFLVYDAKIRRIKFKKDFDFQTAQLKTLFEQVKSERSKEQAKADQSKVQQSAPYTGTKP